MLKMTKKFKFLFGTLVLALGFFFCCSMVSVNAEEVAPETTEQINVVGVYEYNEDGKGTAKFTLYSDNTFSVELYDLEKDETLTGNGTYVLDDNVLIINVDNANVLKFEFKFKVNGNKLEPYEENVETQTIDPNSFLSHLKDFKWEDFEAVIGWVVAYLVANFGIIAFCVIKLILNKLNETKQSKVFQDALAKLSIEHQEKVNEFMNKLDEKLLAVNEADKKFIEEQKATIEKLTNDSTVQIANELKQVTELLK